MDLKCFNQIEERYGLLKADIEGYQFWNYLRAELAWECVKYQMNYQVRQGKNTVDLHRKTIKEMIHLYIRSKIQKQKCDLLVLNHPRRVLVDSFYECIYTDRILQEMKDTVVLEEPYKGVHYTPVYTNRIVYTDIIDFYSYILCSINSILFSKKHKKKIYTMLEMIEKPLEELNQAYGIKLRPEMFSNSLIYGLYLYKAERYYFKKIILKLKPRAIMEVVCYNRKCMVVNEIAKEFNIPTIELQHGTIGEEHIAYNYPEGSRISQFPDYIFLFSDYWKNKAKFPIKEENRKAVGYHHLERMANRIKGKVRETEKQTILFLSSGPIGDRLSCEAVKLSEILDKDKYHIIYKLHPNEYAIWKENYPVLVSTDIEVIDDNRRNLYELYAVSDIQVSGFNSTTVFEGLYFSLRTYILDYCVSKEIDDLCKSGIASYFHSAEELAEMISQKEARKAADLKHILWKENSMQNILTEINRIINKTE